MKRKILKFQNPARKLPVSFRGAKSRTMKSRDADGNDVSYTLYGFNHPTMGLIWADPNLEKNGQYRYFTNEDFDDNGLIKSRSLVENSPRYSYLRSADYNEYLNSPWAKAHPNDVLSEEQFYMGQDAAGSITEAKKTSPLVRAVNNYFGEMNYDMKEGKPMKGKHFWPLAAMGLTGQYSFATAPFATSASLVGGYVGDKVWDMGTLLATGKSWADNMYNWTGLDSAPAKMTNPGMWIGGVTAPYRARVAIYNNKNPFGYGKGMDGTIEGIKPPLLEIKLGVIDWVNPFRSWVPKENPYWKAILQSPKYGNKEAMDGLTLGANAEFRDLIYRKALRLPEGKNGTVFVENGDGTLGVDMNKVNAIRRRWGGEDYDGKVYKLGPGKNVGQNTTSFPSGDNIIGVGGNTTGRFVRNPDTGEITGEMFDPWDIQPFLDDRTIWKWGTENLPFIRNLEMMSGFGGRVPVVNMKIDKPYIY